MTKSFYNLFNRIINRILKYIHKPNIKTHKSTNLIRLGSKYGGWVFENRADTKGGWIISCGLGEDASFDIEVANKTGANIVIIDPTPRAIKHFGQISERLGHPSSSSYVPGGTQSPEAYDLSAIRPDQITLRAEALWINNTPVRFYKPRDAAHVSHSIIFNTNEADDFIIVPTITINEIIDKFKISCVSILKMDIEGAEPEILKSINSWVIIPQQILVEFDILRDAGPSSKREVEYIDELLRSFGFRCVNIEGQNYTYVRP